MQMVSSSKVDTCACFGLHLGLLVVLGQGPAPGVTFVFAAAATCMSVQPIIAAVLERGAPLVLQPACLASLGT